MYYSVVQTREPRDKTPLLTNVRFARNYTKWRSVLFEVRSVPQLLEGWTREFLSPPKEMIAELTRVEREENRNVKTVMLKADINIHTDAIGHRNAITPIVASAHLPKICDRKYRPWQATQEIPPRALQIFAGSDSKTRVYAPEMLEKFGLAILNNPGIHCVSKYFTVEYSVTRLYISADGAASGSFTGFKIGGSQHRCCHNYQKEEDAGIVLFHSHKTMFTLKEFWDAYEEEGEIKKGMTAKDVRENGKLH